MKEQRSKGLFWFAVITAAWSVLLILVGAAVTTTGTGDSVPDWPFSHGTAPGTPAYFALLNWVQHPETFYEHSHRVIAWGCGLLVVILAIWVQKVESRGILKRLAWWAVFAVIIQGVLGGVRVLVVSFGDFQEWLRIHPSSVEPIRILFAVIHGIVAQAIICLIFSLSAMLSPAWGNQKTSEEAISKAPKNYGLSWLIIIMIFGQLMLGALMRHTSAGLIIPDFPTSYGGVAPKLRTMRTDAVEWAKRYNTAQSGGSIYLEKNLNKLTNRELGLRVAVNYLHRLWAILTGWAILVAVMRSNKHKDTPKDIKRLTRWMGWLVLAQIGLGMTVIWTQKHLLITIIHVTVGATILGLSAIYMTRWRSIQLSAQGSTAEKETVEA